MFGRLGFSESEPKFCLKKALALFGTGWPMSFPTIQARGSGQEKMKPRMTERSLSCVGANDRRREG